MFEVVDTKGDHHNVYYVNGMYFLIYDSEYGWKYIEMDECAPV